MGIFLLKRLRNIHRKRRSAMANLPGKQCGSSCQSQGLGGAVQSPPWAEPGTSLGHQLQPGNRWVRSGQGGQSWDPARPLLAGFSGPGGPQDTLGDGDVPCWGGPCTVTAAATVARGGGL